MIELFAKELCRIYSALITLRLDVMQREKLDRAGVVSAGHLQIVITTAVAPMIKILDDLKLDDEVSARAKVIQVRLGREGHHWTNEALGDALQDLQTEVLRALHKRRFAYIPPANAKWFGQEMPFGKRVYQVIPNAQTDIREAANCLAFELHTACVFHLMRAAEHGLRRLARRLRVVPLFKGKRSPVEEEDWNTIIEKLKVRIDAAHQLASRRKKRVMLKLYSDLADHCMFMRNIWRNDVSHARPPYNEHDAQAAWSRVEGFMQLLAGPETQKKVRATAVSNDPNPLVKMLASRSKPKFMGY